MNAKIIKSRLEEMCSHFTFKYNGTECGVDPLSANQYDVWCGENFKTFTSVDEVMNTPFFCGKALKNITSDIDIIDY